MSAETLRRAAALMRERAEAAKAGTPGGMGISIRWSGLRSLAGRGLNEAEAEHLATWSDPAVALAVADWLDRVARPTYCASPGEERSARAIARAYLGDAS